MASNSSLVPASCGEETASATGFVSRRDTRTHLCCGAGDHAELTERAQGAERFSTEAEGCDTCQVCERVQLCRGHAGGQSTASDVCFACRGSRALDVWYLAVSAVKSAGETPVPLSATSTSSEPNSFRRTCRRQMRVIAERHSRGSAHDSDHCAHLHHGSTRIKSVLHQLFHRAGQVQHHLTRADAMYGCSIDSLYPGSMHGER